MSHLRKANRLGFPFGATSSVHFEMFFYCFNFTRGWRRRCRIPLWKWNSWVHVQMTHPNSESNNMWLPSNKMSNQNARAQSILKCCQLKIKNVKIYFQYIDSITLDKRGNAITCLFCAVSADCEEITKPTLSNKIGQQQPQNFEADKWKYRCHSHQKRRTRHF